ncbi:MAG: thiopurine S-methyltransferase [Kangiellaceae bacterium]|nr:thiopurine S-methyltransferase [Kangiellaceae bacterium]
MNAEFWHQKWRKNDIAFHQPTVNNLLVESFRQLNLKPNSRILVPLCGKSKDIGWILSKGHRVVGVELSWLAVEQLFESLQLTPTITREGSLDRYKAGNLDIFVGDIFQLTKGLLGPVDAIYDRAALVALPLELRKRYTSQLIELGQQQSQLVVCYEYKQHEMSGPPFSISSSEIHAHYDAYYEVKLIIQQIVEGGLKGANQAIESIWLLKEKNN